METIKNITCCCRISYEMSLTRQEIRTCYESELKRKNGKSTGLLVLSKASFVNAYENDQKVET